MNGDFESGENDFENDPPDNELPPMMEDRPTLIRVKPGEEINITALDPTIRGITVGVGWDLRRFEGDPVDIDASVFLLDKNDMTVEDEDFVFYNNPSARNGAVRHKGDSRTGAGDGDDENIFVDFMTLPFDVVKLSFVLTIYDMNVAQADFSSVKNVYFRIVNNETGLETFRFELSEELGHETGLHIGYLERIGSDWIFRALGEPIKGGLSRIATDHGIIIAQNVIG